MVNGKKFFFITSIIVLLDQLTKFLARNISESIPLIKNVFHLTLIKNTGAGFGILQGQVWILIFISLIVIGLILFKIDKILKKKEYIWSFGLILGGAIGNLIDRIAFGFVTDFLDFRIWPAFNIADSALVVGVILLLVWSRKSKKD